MNMGRFGGHSFMGHSLKGHFGIDLSLKIAEIQKYVWKLTVDQKYSEYDWNKLSHVFLS